MAILTPCGEVSHTIRPRNKTILDATNEFTKTDSVHLQDRKANCQKRLVNSMVYLFHRKSWLEYYAIRATDLSHHTASANLPLNAS